MVITVQDLFNMNKFNTKHDSKTCEGIPVKTVRLNTQEGEFKVAPFQEKQERLSQEHSGYWPWAKGVDFSRDWKQAARQFAACFFCLPSTLLPTFCSIFLIIGLCACMYTRV